LTVYPHPRVFFVRVANTELKLDAASRIAAKGDMEIVALSGSGQTSGLSSNGSGGAEAGVDFG